MEHLLRQKTIPACKTVLNVLCTQQCPRPSLSQFRPICTGKHLLANYEGDGRTTVAILNKLHKNILMIDTYSSLGFRLNNGIFAAGPVAIFPRTVLHWNVNTASDISPESLSLFALLEPKLDILVVGTGDVRSPLSAEVMHFLRRKRISTEILQTVQACNIFNFLNVEGRCVAGAFIPPTSSSSFSDEFELVDGPKMDVLA